MKFSHLTDTIILFGDEFDNFQTKLIRVGHNLHLKLGVQVLGCRSVFGEPAYPSIEAKAAHLLYFVVKNHPFSDGNKRSGAFLFVDFLHRNGRLLDQNGHPVINDTGLAALTLLVAESDPKQKETLIRLIMHMLKHKQEKS